MWKYTCRRWCKSNHGRYEILHRIYGCIFIESPCIINMDYHYVMINIWHCCNEKSARFILRNRHKISHSCHWWSTLVIGMKEFIYDTSILETKSVFFTFNNIIEMLKYILCSHCVVLWNFGSWLIQVLIYVSASHT